MRRIETLLIGFVLVAGLALPSGVLATDGYFPHGQGTRTKAMAGAGVAFPQDSISVAINPAGTALVGERLDAGAGIFIPNRSYSYDGSSPFVANATQESDTDLFVIPHFGMNWSLDDSSAVGLAVYAAGGMNTDYPNPVYANGSGRTGVNLAQLFISGSYAIDMGNLQLGGAVILAYQTFSAEGLQGFDNDFYSANAGSVTNNGDDTSTGFGVRIGAIFEVSDDFKLGASYQPMIDMEAFAKYSGLFAEGGDFDIPSTYTVGLAWEASDKLTVAADYLAINYTDVAAVSNDGEKVIQAGTAATGFNPLPAADNRLGAANGMGFGWQDIAVIKIGVAWQMNTDWILRGGVSQGDNPIPSDATFFNILAPGVIEQHITAGFTVGLSQDSELSLSFMHALENSQTGTLPDAIFGGTNTITMDQNELELSYGKKF